MHDKHFHSFQANKFTKLSIAEGVSQMRSAKPVVNCQLSIYLFIFLVLFTATAFAQPRVIKGTVYSKNGEKTAGVIVTADKSKDKYYTSFDGFYQINASIKSKWIKFTFPDRVEKINIVGIKRDVIDFGEDPSWNKPDTIKSSRSR